MGKKKPPICNVGDRILTPNKKAGGTVEHTSYTSIKPYKIRWDNGLFGIYSAKDFDKYGYSLEKSCSTSLMSAQELVQDSPLQQLSLEDLTLLDCANEMNGVEESSDKDIPTQSFTKTLESSHTSVHPATSLQVHPLVNPSQFKENARELKTQETVSPISLELSACASQNSSRSKTSEDCSPARGNQDTEKEPTSTIFAVTFEAWASDLSGESLPADILPAPSLESGCFWLESPGALSSTGRSPGLNRLESSLKQKKILLKGECLNPTFLEKSFRLPLDYTNPSESRTAFQLLAEEEKLLEMRSILELQQSHSTESSTSTRLLSEEELTPVDSSCIGKDFWYDRLTVAVRVETVQNWRETPTSDRIIKAAKCKPWWNKDRWGNNFPEVLTIPLPELMEIEELTSPLQTGKSIFSGESPSALVCGDSSDSLEKSSCHTSRQTGSLYQYTANRAGKDGIIREYPIVEGRERDRALDQDWYWGISYVEKSRGKWRDKSSSIPRWSLPLARQLMREKFPVALTIKVCQVKWSWTSEIGNYLIGETKPDACPKLGILSFEDRELLIVPASQWGELRTEVRHQKQKAITKAIAERKPFSYIKELLK